MAKPKREFVDGQYGQIHLRRSGTLSPAHRPLICLHMFPQSGRNFERLLSITPPDRLVIAPDFPGYGESAPPPGKISASEYAASVWRVVDELGLLEAHDSIDLFGIHAGAKLAVEVAHQKPEFINRIVLSSAAVLSSEELDQLRSVFSPIPLDDSGTRLRHLWDILVRNRGPEMSYEMMAASFAEMLRGGEGYEWGHHAVFEYNEMFPHILSQLHHPIAVLNPQDDLYQMTPRTAQHLKNGKVIDFPDWSQGFLETHAEQLWQVIEYFLDAPSKHLFEAGYATAQ